jgi:hypothetical protein
MSDGEKEYVDHFDDVLEDAYKAATVAKQNYPEIPHIALGYVCPNPPHSLNVSLYCCVLTCAWLILPKIPFL